MPSVAAVRLAMIALPAAMAVPAAAQPPQRAAEVAAAAERWCGSDQTSEEQLAATVGTLLVEPAVGIAWLAAELPPATRAPAEPRSKGVVALGTRVVLEFLRRQHATSMTFQGQYDALLPLQPFAGELLLDLLLETPDWYPHTHRIRLVGALRDLLPRPPATTRLDAIVRLVEDAAIEPTNLRRALAALLWQWGTKQYAQAMVVDLVAATGEGDAEDRVQTTLELADFYTQLREYRQAATAHRSAQTLARQTQVGLRPIAWYAAACVHALLGDVERGIAALEELAALQASPDLDGSLRVARTMLETDPELAPLRRDPRFPSLLARACPAAPPGAKDGR